MAEYFECAVCHRKEHFWKGARIESGEYCCPKCYFRLVEATGVFGTLKDYNEWKKNMKEHRNLINNYINLLKKYGTYLKDKKFISRVMLIEEEICESLFKKHRQQITGRPEELFLIATVQCQLLKDFPEIKEEEIKDLPTTLFNKNHDRYYNNTTHTY